MNKSNQREIADRLNVIIGDMTRIEVEMARTSHEHGVGISDIGPWINRMSHNSSMLAEIYRELAGIK